MEVGVACEQGGVNPNISYLYGTWRVSSCSITTELFKKNGYDLNACNNIRDVFYNADVLTNIVKSIVHSPVGKLV